VPLNLLVDDLSAIVVVAVAIVGLAVQLFSKWYLHDDDRYGVFVASVSLFLSAMFLVVLSGDLVLTLIGWEVMAGARTCSSATTAARSPPTRLPPKRSWSPGSPTWPS